MQPNKQTSSFLPLSLLYGSLVLNYFAYLHLFLYSGKATEWLQLPMSNRRMVLQLLAYVPLFVLIAVAIAMVRKFWRADFKAANPSVKRLFVFWSVLAVLLSVAFCPIFELEFSIWGVTAVGLVYLILSLVVWRMSKN